METSGAVVREVESRTHSALYSAEPHRSTQGSALIQGKDSHLGFSPRVVEEGGGWTVQPVHLRILRSLYGAIEKVLLISIELPVSKDEQD